MILPPPLRPGDRVRVIAPSSPFDRALVLRGLGFLAERYEVLFEPGLLDRHRGFLAGSDARRRAELEAALADPATRAVVAARGGHGATRLLGGLDVGRLRDRAQWWVGFSDVTALHAECWRAGLSSLHAHNLAGLGRGDARRRAAWVEALEAPARERVFPGLGALARGRATGVLVGGNLTVLAAMATAGRLQVPDGAVLMLEDVAEAPYRVDRCLATLERGGHLDRAAAVVLGEFTDCPPGRHGVPVEDALGDALGRLGVPVLAGLPVGHGERNEPLPLGVPARVDATLGVLTVCPAGAT